MPSEYSKAVLIVDDDPSDRKLFWRELDKQGFPVVVTGSPDDAMAAVVSGNVGCMITDQLMAVKGQELAEIAAGIRSDLSIIVFSGASSPREPMPPGAIFVFKDDLPKLIQTVTECMDRWRR